MSTSRFLIGPAVAFLVSMMLSAPAVSWATPCSVVAQFSGLTSQMGRVFRDGTASTESPRWRYARTRSCSRRLGIKVRSSRTAAQRAAGKKAAATRKSKKAPALVG